jgi:hypothetical protein
MLRVLLLLLLVSAAPVAQALSDALNWQWHDDHQLPVHWDNVEGAPQWLAGVRPRRAPGGRLHSVELAPGDWTTVELPAGQWLRLVSLQGRLAEGEVQVTRSVDGVLYLPQRLQASADGQSLLSGDLHRSVARLRIERAPAAAGPLQLALFVSRTPVTGEVPAYPHPLVIDSGAEAVGVSERPGRQTWWHLTAGQAASLTVHGPQRLELHSRLALAPHTRSAEQVYRIEAQLNQAALQVLELESGDERRTSVMVDGCVTPVARHERAYVDIPPGRHHLTLRVSRNLYVQLLGSRGDGDYWFAGNAPQLPVTASADAEQPSLWALARSAVVRLFEPDVPMAEAERSAQRLARDNHWEAGNLQAAAGLAGVQGYSAQQLARFDPAAQRAASLRRYVDLLPLPADAGFAQRSFSFSTASLARRVEAQLIWQPQLGSLAGEVASAAFTATPTDPARALRFQLPEHGHDTRLRLAVVGASLATAPVLYVSFDGGEPQTVLLDTTEGRVAPLLRPDAASLAASLRSQTEADWRAAYVQLPWGELQVPAGVRTVSLWAARDALWTAVQVLEAAAYTGGEGDYRAALEALGRAQALTRFIARLRELGQGRLAAEPVSGNAAEAELDNLWLPLLRYLAAQSRYFPMLSPAAQPGLDSVAVDAQRALGYQRRAEQAQQAGDRVLAIELWSRAVRGLDGEARDAARLRRARVLRDEGEALLADRELWQLYRDSASASLRQAALALLLDDANRVSDPEAGVRILASALLVRPAPELLERIVPLLVETGEAQQALQLGLLLPPAQRPLADLLRAARDAGWWGLYEQLIAQLPAGEEMSFWSGWPALAGGDAAAALAVWQQGGAAGQAAARRLHTALAIRAGLNATAQEDRVAALLEWEKWQQQTLAGGHWRLAPETVVRHAGGRTVVIPELGLQLRRYRATPAQPLQLAVYGPIRVRVSLRPLHPRGAQTPVDDWLLVSGSGTQQRFPINGNAPDRQRQLAGDATSILGQRDRVVLELGPGYHRLQLALRDRDALFAVETLQPRGFETILPVLTPQRAQAVLQAPPSGTATTAKPLRWPVELAQDCATRRVQVEVRPAPPAPALDPTLFAAVTAARMPQPLPPHTDPATQLAELLWQAEQDPSRLGEVAVRAEILYASATERAGLRGAMQRLRRAVTWRPVTNLWQRAGERDISLLHAMPEHPAARIRHALLPALGAGQQRLGGRDTLVFSLEQPQPVDFAFDLLLETLQEQPAGALSVGVRLDNRQERVVRLTPQRPRSDYRVRVAGGAHSVRLRLLDPLAGHSVRVAVREQQADGNWTQHPLEPVRRSYHVASSEEPLVVYAEGPGLLRVDEWNGDSIGSRYRRIEAGWHKQVFAVPAGRDEALYRVFELKAKAVQPRLSLHPAGVPGEALAPRALSPTAAVSAAPALRDSLPLGGQEDGTLTGTLELASRRNLDEDRDASGEAERFVELRATHRRYLGSRDGYHRFDALSRAREHGGPTFGLREFLTLPSDWHALQFDFNASLYLQRPGGGAGTDWLGDLRGRVSQRRDLGARVHHRPALLLFRRWMSRDEALEDEPERVDQDVFTDYKRDHLQGVQLGDDLFYRSRADVAGWLGARVGSNEALNLFDPDHVRGRVGVRWLLRDWDVEAEYTATRYFADPDRASDRTRERLRLEAQMLRWNDPRNGLQLGLRLDHDITAQENSGWMTLSWHRANGRLLRDFRPADLNFRGLRERHTNSRLFARQGDKQP